MKSETFRKIIREEVKAAIQEELKDILLEAVRAPKTVVSEAPVKAPPVQAPSKTREQIRESYKNVLGETAQAFNTSHINQPLQISSTDTASPNSALPTGEVSMDQIMGLMNK